MLLFFFCSTFVCPTEIIAFSDKANEFHDINCEVVGVSVDSHFTHLAWTNTPRKVETFSHCDTNQSIRIMHFSLENTVSK